MMMEIEGRIEQDFNKGGAHLICALRLQEGARRSSADQINGSAAKLENRGQLAQRATRLVFDNPDASIA